MKYKNVKEVDFKSLENFNKIPLPENNLNKSFSILYLILLKFTRNEVLL